MAEIPRQGVRQLPRHNSRELSGFEVGPVYNNGITATAEAVEIEDRDGMSVMTRLTNLQIVNGGQTSASIHAAMRNKTDLSKTFVQMKLSIVDADRAEKIVPDISRYANSQNKIAAADFFSNHPFHVRMEEISRRIYAPAKVGAFTQSRWFYERARGQYADRRSRLTVAQRKKFDLEHPRAQVFSKTDLAKIEMTWRTRPEIVCLGAQKNFAHFAHAIGQRWDQNEKEYSEEWFKNAIVKLIIFKKTERVIPPFLTGCGRRTHAAIFSFMAGVMPPMPMLGRSLL